MSFSGMMMMNILGRGTLQARQANTGPVLGQLPAGGWQRLRGRLATRNWAWMPLYLKSISNPYKASWGQEVGLWRVVKPYSWATRKKLVQDTMREALIDVYANKPAVTDDVRKTFKRLHVLQDKPGKTLLECSEELDRLKTEYAQLEAARDNFRKSGQAKHERVPQLNAAAKQAFLEARMAQEVAEAVLFDCSDAKDQASGAAAKGILDTAANAVVARYRAGTPEHVAALVAAQRVTAIPVGATAVETSNTIQKAASDAAKTAEKTLSRTTRFLGSPTFEAYARKVEELEKRLKVIAGETLAALANGDSDVYRSTTAFETYYNAVFEEFGRAVDTAQKLDGFRLSLGLPALRQDRIESSGKYKFKQFVRENKGSAVEWGLSLALSAAEYGAYKLISGGSVPGWISGGALLIGATAFNLAAVKAVQFLAEDD